MRITLMLVCKSQPALGLQEPASQGQGHALQLNSCATLLYRALMTAEQASCVTSRGEAYVPSPLMATNPLVENVMGRGLCLAGIGELGQFGCMECINCITQQS